MNLEVRILNELRGCFLDLRILQELVKSRVVRSTRSAKRNSRGFEATNTGKHST